MRKKLALLAMVGLVTAANVTAAPIKMSGGAVAHRAGAAPPHQIPAAGVLDGADLIAIAQLKATSASDQFSDDRTSIFIGRDFSVVLPEGQVSIDYDKDNHVLTASHSNYLNEVDLSKSLSRGAYTGQNAFGAKAVISKIRGNSYGIWLPGSPYDHKEMKFTKPMDGAAARDLSKSIRLKVSGTVIRADGVYSDAGSPIFEKPVISDPTVSDPYDTWIKGFYVAVKVSHVEWIDARSGAVLDTQDIPG